jgi:hypothetical protein
VDIEHRHSNTVPYSRYSRIFRFDLLTGTVRTLFTTQLFLNEVILGSASGSRISNIAINKDTGSLTFRHAVTEKLRNRLSKYSFAEIVKISGTVEPVLCW